MDTELPPIPERGDLPQAPCPRCGQPVWGLQCGIWMGTLDDGVVYAGECEPCGLELNAYLTYEEKKNKAKFEWEPAT